MRRVDALFDISYGSRGLGSKSLLDSGHVPVVASGDDRMTSGIYAFKSVEPRFSGVITVARTGSAGAAHYRDHPCEVSDDALVLRPRRQMGEREMVWYQEALRAHRFRWSYGRKVIPDKLGRILVPDPPAWVSSAEMPDLAGWAKPVATGPRNEALVPSGWHRFRLGDLFEMKRGGGLTTYEANEVPGDAPFVGAAKTNNAVVALTVSGRSGPSFPRRA